MPTSTEFIDLEDRYGAHNYHPQADAAWTAIAPPGVVATRAKKNAAQRAAF
jgi:hypothetical protein